MQLYFFFLKLVTRDGYYYESSLQMCYLRLFAYLFCISFWQYFQKNIVKGGGKGGLSIYGVVYRKESLKLLHTMN